MTIRVITNEGGPSYFVCPQCQQRNTLGVYWAAHQHIELAGKCQSGKCMASFTILGHKISMEPPK